MYSTNRRRYYLSGQRFGEMSPSSSEERVFLAKKNQRFAKKCLQTGLYWAIIVRRGNTAAKTNHTFRDFPSQCRLVGTDTTGCGSRRIFCPNFSAKNLEIQKVFLRFSSLNLVQNLSTPALAVASVFPLQWTGEMSEMAVKTKRRKNKWQSYP